MIKIKTEANGNITFLLPNNQTKQFQKGSIKNSKAIKEILNTANNLSDYEKSILAEMIKIL